MNNSNSNNLEPPEDGSLVKFPTWQLLRSRVYSWKHWVKKQTEKSGKTGGKTPIALEGTDKILYDLVRGNRMPRGRSSPTVIILHPLTYLQFSIIYIYYLHPFTLLFPPTSTCICFLSLFVTSRR